jgi:protein-S-isoprenylcysteine O-methyltransferase Ste14
MNAFWLLIPVLLIRYGVLGLLDRPALKRAAFFPPMAGKEKTAYLIYQIATVFILIYPFFLKVGTDGPMFIIGLTVYGLGIIVYTASTISFARPERNGINQKGLYRISRNPMYIGYFIYFLGCVLLTRSIVLFAALIIFQISAHWIILSEERWCINEFGESYINYMNKVRRYL